MLLASASGCKEKISNRAIRELDTRGSTVTLLAPVGEKADVFLKLLSNGKGLLWKRKPI